MAVYKFFLLRDGKPLEMVNRDLADDLEALEEARSLCHDHVVEVYEDIHLVARVKQANEPLNASDQSPWSKEASRLAAMGAIADFVKKGGRVMKIAEALPVTGPEVLDYLSSCGIAAKPCFTSTRDTYVCNGKYVSLRKLVDVANGHRLSQQLPLFSVKV
jgi:hypothetical protein